MQKKVRGEKYKKKSVKRRERGEGNQEEDRSAVYSVDEQKYIFLHLPVNVARPLALRFQVDE